MDAFTSACMHSPLHACIHLCMHAFTSACMHSPMHTCMHILMYACTCAYACMHAFIYFCMHAPVRMHASMHACMHRFLSVGCICVCFFSVLIAASICFIFAHAELKSFLVSRGGPPGGPPMGAPPLWGPPHYPAFKGEGETASSCLLSRNSSWGCCMQRLVANGDSRSLCCAASSSPSKP